MSPETALLLDAWDTVKSFIPAKERLHVAEELVNMTQGGEGNCLLSRELCDFPIIV
mgnify:CR=1 FL=1